MERMTEWTAMFSPNIVPVEVAGTALVTVEDRMELIREREQTRGICRRRKSVKVVSRDKR